MPENEDANIFTDLSDASLDSEADDPVLADAKLKEQAMSDVINEEDQSGGLRGKFALFALLFSVFGVIWFAAAALGSKYGLWSWQFGLGKMTVAWGPIVAFGALGISVLACVTALIKAPRKRPLMLGIGALLVAGLLAGRLAGLGAGAQAVPPIHDIQTNWADPVIFSEALMAERGPDSNPVRYGADAVFRDSENEQFGGKLIADIQEAAECTSRDEDVCEDSETPKPYAPLEPLVIKAAPEKVFEAALHLVEQRGWTVVEADPLQGLLEATHTSPWWGFKDDVAIRFRGQEDGTVRVDMRSISRVGGSDLGANARRITAFLYDLDGQRYN